jgi:hypothetical protein
MNLTTTRCLLATAALLVLPIANANPLDHVEGVDSLRCATNPGYVLDRPLCPSDYPGHTCDGASLFILSNDQCHSTSGAGCEAPVQVFILSDNNCHGGPGGAGCKGIKLFAPGSEENCQGGGGNSTVDLLNLPFP